MSVNGDFGRPAPTGFDIEDPSQHTSFPPAVMPLATPSPKSKKHHTPGAPVKPGLGSTITPAGIKPLDLSGKSVETEPVTGKDDDEELCSDDDEDDDDDDDDEVDGVVAGSGSDSDAEATHQPPAKTNKTATNGTSNGRHAAPPATGSLSSAAVQNAVAIAKASMAKSAGATLKPTGSAEPPAKPTKSASRAKNGKDAPKPAPAAEPAAPDSKPAPKKRSRPAAQIPVIASVVAPGETRPASARSPGNGAALLNDVLGVAKGVAMSKHNPVSRSDLVSLLSYLPREAESDPDVLRVIGQIATSFGIDDDDGAWCALAARKKPRLN